MRAAILALLVTTPGCGILNLCHHPDQEELSCEALPPASTEAGCTGRPAEDSGDPMTHVDERYPVGCVIRLPVCSASYYDSTKTCSCQDISGAGSAPTWVCPL